MPKSKTIPTRKRDAVSFRITSPEIMLALEEEAEREGEKVGICARRLVVRALTDAGHQELHHEMERLQAGQRKLREDFATVALALLVKVANEDPEKAKAWLREHLMS